MPADAMPALGIAASAVAPVVGHAAVIDDTELGAGSSSQSSSAPASPRLASIESVADVRPTAASSVHGEASGHGGDGTGLQEDVSSHEDASGPIARQPSAVDIEHLPVDDDPRLWSARRKGYVLYGGLAVALG